LVATYTTALAENMLDYSASLRAPGLLPGLYRLVTLVTLHGSAQLIGYHEGPIVEVVTVQPTSSPATPPQVVLPSGGV